MGTRQTSPGKPNYRGLDLEKTSRLRSRQKFFLDIPFNRTHQPRVKIVFPVLTCAIARGPSHAARAFAEDRHAVTSRRTCS
jgi:hypothetical protein